MLGQKNGEMGYDVQARESHGRRYAQSSLQRCSITARGGFRLLGLLDRSFGALIEGSGPLPSARGHVSIAATVALRAGPRVAR